MKKENKKQETNPEKDKKTYDKQLKVIVVCIAAAVVFLVFAFVVVSSVRHFDYRNVKYDVVKEGEIIFYNTALPFYTITGKHVADYNVYLRKDPRELRDIKFEGEFVQKQDLVLNLTEEFNCDGDGVIAIANFVQVFEALGTRVVKDPNAMCDSQGRYMFTQIKSSDETKIQQTGPACYDIYIADCEILDGTERFIQELLVKINDEKT